MRADTTDDNRQDLYLDPSIRVGSTCFQVKLTTGLGLDTDNHRDGKLTTLEGRLMTDPRRSSETLRDDAFEFFT